MSSQIINAGGGRARLYDRYACFFGLVYSFAITFNGFDSVEIIRLDSCEIISLDS